MRESIKARNLVQHAIHSVTFINILPYSPIVHVFFFNFFKKTEKNVDRGDVKCAIKGSDSINSSNSSPVSVSVRNTISSSIMHLYIKRPLAHPVYSIYCI